jgi:hypothetical protein
MASLAKGQILIKVITPEQMGQAVAEWVLARQGVTEGSSVRVKTEFVFTRGNKQFSQCRVEVEGE